MKWEFSQELNLKILFYQNKSSVDDVLSLLQGVKMFQINLLIYSMISIKPPTEKTALRETLFLVDIILN